MEGRRSWGWMLKTSLTGAYPPSQHFPESIHQFVMVHDNLFCDHFQYENPTRNGENCLEYIVFDNIEV